jgi:hypothetical protein
LGVAVVRGSLTAIERVMRRRFLAFYAVGLLLAFVAGWNLRGLDPELSCKAKGGFYSEELHVCNFVEPSEETLDRAISDASAHRKSQH